MIIFRLCWRDLITLSSRLIDSDEHGLGFLHRCGRANLLHRWNRLLDRCFQSLTLCWVRPWWLLFLIQWFHRLYLCLLDRILQRFSCLRLLSFFSLLFYPEYLVWVLVVIFWFLSFSWCLLYSHLGPDRQSFVHWRPRFLLLWVILLLFSLLLTLPCGWSVVLGIPWVRFSRADQIFRYLRISCRWSYRISWVCCWPLISNPCVLRGIILWVWLRRWLYLRHLFRWLLVFCFNRRTIWPWWLCSKFWWGRWVPWMLQLLLGLRWRWWRRWSHWWRLRWEFFLGHRFWDWFFRFYIKPNRWLKRWVHRYRWGSVLRICWGVGWRGRWFWRCC